MIKHSKPTLDKEEKRRLTEIIESGEVGFTNSVKKFEEALRKKIEVRHTIATNSGSSALHLALLVLNVTENDEVIIPSYCCSALLNAVNYVGARVVFADICEDTFNIAPESVKKNLSKKTKAVIVPHMFGLPADIDVIKSFGVPVIEDCAMTLCARLNSKQVGTFGDLSVTSFYATKLITTGTGGAIFTNSNKFANSIRDLISYDKRHNYKIRYNYKMTALQSVLGIAQLNKLNKIIDKRKAIAIKYKQYLKEWADLLPKEFNDREHIFYRFVIKMRNKVQEAEKFFYKRKIEVKRPVFKPMHYYFGKDLFGLHKTEDVYDSALSLPIYPSLKSSEVKKVSDVLKEFLRRNYE